MITFPNKYTVGFQQRNHDDKTLEKGGSYPLGFYTLDTTLTSWTNWRNKTIPPMEIMNTPRNEFKVYGQTKRDGGWNGSGRSMVYIQHPDCFIWEITVENLINILDTCDIVNGEFTDEMVIGKEGKNYVLIPVKSQVYQDYLARLNQPKIKKNAIDLVSGDIVTIGKSQWTFVGNFDTVDTSEDYENTPTICNTKKGSISLFMQTIKGKNEFKRKDLKKLKNIEYLGNTHIDKNKIVIDNTLLSHDYRYDNTYNTGTIILLDGSTNFRFDNSFTSRFNFGEIYDRINVIDLNNFVTSCKHIENYMHLKSLVTFANAGRTVFKQDYKGVTYESAF